MDEIYDETGLDVTGPNMPLTPALMALPITKTTFVSIHIGYFSFFSIQLGIITLYNGYNEISVNQPISAGLLKNVRAGVNGM